MNTKNEKNQIFTDQDIIKQEDLNKNSKSDRNKVDNQ